ncbi:MAG: hydrolase [Pseudonocardiales bacterium]|nr:hydrolase [Jatrophihabitantaceae bacterium]MCW2604404.1 hydrolase [Pseudonocardiales bacterium]
MTQPPYEVVGSVERFRGRVVRLRTDEVRMSDGSVAARDIIEHPGAVAVAALDEHDRIVLVRQYRHPVGAFLDELPAGLLDVDGEPALEAAKRELAEEAGLAAAVWHTLVDVHTTPGGSDEAVRVYLARALMPAAAAGFVLEDEELQITVSRVPLAEAAQRVLSGEITNSLAVAGILAAARVAGAGEAALRPADAAWPARPGR